MSKPSEAKRLRRVKRRAKKMLFFDRLREIELFQWQQFLGIPDPDSTYYPSKDPAVSNHRRVIGQRIMSGRIKGGPVGESDDRVKV